MPTRRKSKRATVALICFALLASGCGSGRTMLIADDVPVRIGPDVTGRVYVLTDGDWTLSENVVRIPEGWYCVPPRFVEP